MWRSTYIQVLLVCALWSMPVRGYGGAQPFPPVLSHPRVINGQIEFTLAGRTNDTHIIERSFDGRFWTPVQTNGPGPVTQLIRFPAEGPLAYFRARVAPLVGYALLSRTVISRNGYSLRVNSFDSSDPNASTDGQYDSLKATDSGHVAAFEGLTDGGTVELYGKLSTGSASNMAVEIGPQGAIGETFWHLTGHKGIQPGWWHTNLTLNLQSVPSPAGPWLTPHGYAANGQFYDFVLTNSDYKLNRLSLSGSAKMLAMGSCRLFITGDVNLTGESFIELAPAAKLTLYVGGTAYLGGLGIVGATNPTNFIYRGLSTNTRTEVAFSPFTGVIYAPEAETILSGSAVHGAITARRITLTRPVEVHFDEHLLKSLAL